MLEYSLSTFFISLLLIYRSTSCPDCRLLTSLPAIASDHLVIVVCTFSLMFLSGPVLRPTEGDVNICGKVWILLNVFVLITYCEECKSWNARLIFLRVFSALRQYLQSEALGLWSQCMSTFWMSDFMVGRITPRMPLVEAACRGSHNSVDRSDCCFLLKPRGPVI